MNWLSMLSDSEKKEIVSKLCMLISNELEKDNFVLTNTLGSIVDASFARHGFRPGQSCVSVAANIIHDQSARDREAARAEAIQRLKVAAQDSSNVFAELSHGKSIHPTTGNALAGRLRDAIAAVEREFKQ